ncbi:MAG TPA: fatty acid desaturase [Pirellulales bacterium]|nr:fatty acid desaturase [Pirellulales bacterium]
MPQRVYCNSDANFSIREARSIVRDLFEPNPAIYWGDFLSSLALGAACFFASRRVTPYSPGQVLLALAACLAYYRAALFIHELTHLRKESFVAFRVAWNVLCGIPFFMPSFLYYTHLAHHARQHYGTPDDGEYLPLGIRPRGETLKYLLQPLVIPVLAVLRFVLFTPLTWVSPRLRRFVQQRASSMVMDPSYVRPLPKPVELRIWRLQEAGCFLYGLAAAILFAGGWLPVSLLAHAYVTAVVVLLLNHVRTLGAHRFRHQGEPLTFVEQLLDSVNYPRWPLTSELWAPVGLRFHALHHLFPSLPYHALPEAHRRLMRQLPGESPYRRTESRGLWASLRELWQAAGSSSPEAVSPHGGGTRTGRAAGGATMSGAA